MLGEHYRGEICGLGGNLGEYRGIDHAQALHVTNAAGSVDDRAMMMEGPPKERVVGPLQYKRAHSEIADAGLGNADGRGHVKVDTGDRQENLSPNNHRKA